VYPSRLSAIVQGCDQMSLGGLRWPTPFRAINQVARVGANLDKEKCVP